MPHFLLEYTDNIKPEARIPELQQKVNAILMAQGGVCPTVHATLKIGAGRSEAEKKKTRDELFAMRREHFAPVLAKRYLALSLELGEFSEASTCKQNKLHARFKKEQAHVG